MEDRSGDEVDLAAVAATARRVLAALGYDRGELGITFVGLEEIASLNREHLGREGTTDVIAFPLDEATAAADSADVPLLLGDVVISPGVARENWGAYGTSFPGELCRLVIHGILHVTGYDHESDAGEMHAKEEELVAALCGEGPHGGDPF